MRPKFDPRSQSMSKTGSRYFWYCNVCESQNSREDGECQYCECEGFGKCKRDNCSDPIHFIQSVNEGRPLRIIHERA